MSFFTDARPGVFPGLTNNPLNGLCERIAIQVKKVFDACIYQAQLENYRLTVSNFNPETPAFPLTFISAYSTNAPAQVTNLIITRFDDRPNFARVEADINIPVIVTYTDANGVTGTATATVTIHQDVILFVPQPSIVPISVEAFGNATSTIGTFVDESTFSVTACVTLILKVVADVDVLVPSYGYVSIPPCTPFVSDEVCPGTMDMPLFPTAVAPQSSNPNNNR